MERTKTVVNIGGKHYTLCGTESAEYIHRVALKVNSKLEELRSNHPDTPNIDLALLTAINLADEYLKTYDELEATKKELTRAKKAPAAKGTRSSAKKASTTQQQS